MSDNANPDGDNSAAGCRDMSPDVTLPATMFHHDMIHAEVPSKATLLYSVEIPSTGGNTLFASGYAAYDALDPAIRDRLEGRKAVHHYNYGSTQRGDSRGTVAFAECAHPVFRARVIADSDTRRGGAPPADHESVVFNTVNNFSTSSSVFHTCGVTRMA